MTTIISNTQNGQHLFKLPKKLDAKARILVAREHKRLQLERNLNATRIAHHVNIMFQLGLPFGWGK